MFQSVHDVLINVQIVVFYRYFQGTSTTEYTGLGLPRHKRLTSQEAYDEAMIGLFDALDKVMLQQNVNLKFSFKKSYFKYTC